MEKKHLPFFGVGPLFVIVIIVLTIAGILVTSFGFISQITFSDFYIPVAIIGIALIFIGIRLWYSANFKSKLDENIRNNRLITTGVYACVRNPVYSAFLLACTGVLLLANNVWLLVLPVIFWIYLTLLMKCTEEKWLADLYGGEYKEYCKKVNRCIPYFKSISD